MEGMSDFMKSWFHACQDETQVPREIVNACRHTALTALIDNVPKKINAAFVESIADVRLPALLRAWRFVKDSGKQAFVGAVVTKQGPDGMKAKCIEKFYNKIESLTSKVLLHSRVSCRVAAMLCTTFCSGARAWEVFGEFGEAFVHSIVFGSVNL
jgi:hypothetical protein